MPSQPIVRDRDPVVGHRETLSHDALVGAVQAERHLDVVGAVLGNKSEDVTDFMHRLGDDALALGAGIQPHEPVGRDDYAVGHHDVVVRRKLLPRLFVEQLHEMAAVELAGVSTGIARMRKIPVDAVPVGERITYAPTRIPPNAEIVDPDFVGEACNPKDRRNSIEDCLEM